MKQLKKIVFLLLMLSFSAQLWATHIRSVDIKLQPLCSVNDFTYQVIIIVYTDNHSQARAGGSATLDFGDGSVINNMSAQFVPLNVSGFDSDVSVFQFTTTHTYSGYGKYKISYRESHRNIELLNIANADDQVDYITFLEFTIDPRTICNHIPVLTVPPLDKACRQATFYHSSGAFDDEHDSLSYELSIPFRSRTTQAPYTTPINNTFYGSIFNVGNEDDTGPPTFSIDPISGLLTWDAPGQIGQYNIAFKIVEWRKDSVTGIYDVLSTTTRDMQIIVEPCTNKKPQLVVPQDICVVAGTVIDQSIFGTDADSDSVKIEVFGQVVEFDVDEFPASYSPNPAKFQKPKATLQFHWQTDCMHVSNQSYQVVFKITDKPTSGTKLVNFKIWNIKVIAPAPQLQNAQLDIVQNRAVLDWDSYACTNASSIQIWRKVGSYDYSPGSCDVGVPRSTGYNLIATVPGSDTNFIDDNVGMGLSPGAVYCYRLVAYFNAPASTSSIVSIEMCVGPVRADAPVITHVTVEETAEVDGRIRVSWCGPERFGKIDVNQFPPATYEYEIYRADDFIGDANIAKVGRVTDTTFLDPMLNTEEKVFNYRIVLYALPPLATKKIAVDTSAVASSERLTPTPGVGLISLAWRDSVPWSNVVQERPYHLIYRGIDDANPVNMILYDSINVAANGFNYIDHGPLEDDREYSYRVLTRGTYGNDTIPLQENFSQVVSANPVSNLLPCSPALTINKIDCDQYLTGANCDQTIFSNTISWSIKALRGCRKNIDYYKIYTSQSSDGDFLLLTTVSDTFYIDSGLPSYARCYKISAVDKLGVESALSEATCNDNCPFFMLPNVFTPGNTDGFNDTFNANFDDEVVANPEEVVVRCPRFVEQVKFEVFNRWGEQVYTSTSANGGSLNIEWKGIDKKGKELANGIYYYTAEVQFNVSDPKKRIKEYRGWVKLIR